MQALHGEGMTMYGTARRRGPSSTSTTPRRPGQARRIHELRRDAHRQHRRLLRVQTFTIGEFVLLVREIAKKVEKGDGALPARRVRVIYGGLPTNVPLKRHADTTHAKQVLDWQFRRTVRIGVEEMVHYYKAKAADIWGFT